MLVTQSQHSDSLRRTYLILRTEGGQKRQLAPSLNLSFLIRLIQEATREGTFKRNKRALSPSSSNATASAKRRRYASPQSGGCLIFRHLFDVGYTTDGPGETDSPLAFHQESSGDAYADCLEFETQLVELLDDLFGSSTESQFLNLGPVISCPHFDRLSIKGAEGSHEWLLLLPQLLDTLESDAFDYASNSLRDIVLACHLLSMHERADINFSVRLLSLPKDSYDAPRQMPFRLHIEMTVHLHPSVMYAPTHPLPPKKLAIVEDAQRRFLTHVFPPASPLRSVAQIDIPFFYSTLNPAPNLQTRSAEDSMQPRALRPKLLPFQRRSVAWLLDREGKRVDEFGNVSGKPSTQAPASRSEPLFWERIELDHDNPYYFNRLTGALVPYSRYQDDFAPGGLLAEEPGLGKTLECIALTMLNPAGPDRDPTVERWDPETEIYVKEVKTTLIVTPPSLASQWADELALHAPGLEVLVYEGWEKGGAPDTITGTKNHGAPRSQARANGTANVPGDRTRFVVSGKRNGQARPRNKRSNGPSDNTDEENADANNDRDMEETGEDAVGKQAFDWCSYIHSFDVCITTYTTLQRDFKLARTPPVRPRREDVVYSNIQRSRSPLVMCNWYRVIMDEVQMVGGGNTAKMVSLIPRFSSWAVSGTPAKTAVSDLIHILKFLRVENMIGPPQLWKRLQKPAFAPYFAKFFNHIAIRTTKLSVMNELTIPQQTRYLVSIELGPVERHVYDQAFQEGLVQLGYDARGVTVTEGLQPDLMQLRAFIKRIRGICTHPQVGQLQRPGDKFKSNALHTIGQVLEGMIDQGWRTFMDTRRSTTEVMIRSARLHGLVPELAARQRALEILQEAENAVHELLRDIEAAITEHDAAGDDLKKLHVSQNEGKGPETWPDRATEANLEPSEGKGKGRTVGEHSVTAPSDFPPEPDGGNWTKTPAGEEHAAKRRALQLRLRESRVTLHQIKFFLGDVFHALGDAHGSAESEAYAAAEGVRRDLLRIAEANAVRAMAQLTKTTDSKSLRKSDVLIPTPFMSGGGTKSKFLFDEANDLIDLLNQQSQLLWNWKSKITALLTQELYAGGGDADGEEYARTLNTQGEAETYLQAYAALIADRREVLVAERTLLAAHEGQAKEKKERKTKVAMQAVQAMLETMDGEAQVQPEHEILWKEMSDERKDLLATFQGRAIKSVLVNLSAVQMKIANENDPEKAIAKNGAARLRKFIVEQNNVMDKLDADLALFRKAFNERILYFKQLQEISDSVTEVECSGDVATALQACGNEQQTLVDKIQRSRAHLRYLKNLVKRQEENDLEDTNVCILCKCEFSRGYVTQCAHMYCQGCMNAWLSKKGGKFCPVCRKEIDSKTVSLFTLNEEQPVPPVPRPFNADAVPVSRRQIHYNFIDPEVLQAIQQIEQLGSFGSKIDTLVRHLMYIRYSDPGAKSIVFSAWQDSLSIIQHALVSNNIKCLRIDQASRKHSPVNRFKNDPDILVLLLHGDRENAGLNVTCASRVFLVESVVHHAFEMQAIARIDRMGQKNPTEVYCYYAENTVERNILDLAAKQGLSLYTRDRATDAIDVSAFAYDSRRPKKGSPYQRAQRGDFISKTEDMLAVLFPHLFEELKYLLPEGDMANGNHDHSPDPPRQSRSRSEQAVAGPSKLQ